MRKFLAAIPATALLGSSAFAQTPPAAPDMVLLPRAVAETAAQWIAQPNSDNAVQLYAALMACIANNPHGGVTVRSGPDQCPVVTDAIAARDKEIADLKKADASAAAPAPAAAAAPDAAKAAAPPR